MDTRPLRTWLGLPPGPWPPPDRELLGLGGEPLTPALVELRALAQMEKLRPHQLLHPDLVTEGMNRLAAAMIALTNAAAAAQPVPPPPPAPTMPRRKRRKPAKAPAAAPEVMDAEPVLDAERVRHDLFLPPSPVGREAVVRDEIPPPISAATEAYPRQVVVSRDRRAAYRRLVLLRRLRRAMEKLGPFIGDPGELLLTSGRVFGFVAAAREVRSGWAAVAPEWPVRHGRLVVRVVADPLALPLFRGLVPTQRANLAADWALAVGELERAAAGLRESLRVTRPGKALASRAKAIRVWLRMNPEWVLAVAAVGVLAAAVARTVARAAT